MARLQYFLDVSREDGSYIPYHYHPCYEFVFYCKGSGENQYISTVEAPSGRANFTFENPAVQTAEAQTMPFEKDTLLLYQPNCYHNETWQKGGKVIAFGFLTDAPMDLQKMAYTDLPQEVGQHIYSIAQEYRNKSEGYLEAINSMIDLLVIYLTRLESKHDAGQVNMETVRSYIDNYYMTNIKIADLAKSSFYTTDHFIRVFHKEFGLHPKQYVQKKRLEESMRLLKNTDITIYEIASRVGYNSNAEFSAFIKKSTGQTPTQIRRSAIRERAQKAGPKVGGEE